jgi:hypothetical protein
MIIVWLENDVTYEYIDSEVTHAYSHKYYIEIIPFLIIRLIYIYIYMGGGGGGTADFGDNYIFNV